MTIKELCDLLASYPDDAEVFVIKEREVGKLTGTMMNIGLSWTIDQDSAKGSLCFYPK